MKVATKKRTRSRRSIRETKARMIRRRRSGLRRRRYRTSRHADKLVNQGDGDNQCDSLLQYMEILKGKKAQDAKPGDTATEKKTESGHGPLKLLTVKIRGLGYNHKKKHIKQFFHPLVPKSIRVPQKIKGIAYVGFKTEKQLKQALNKNKSFLGEFRRVYLRLFS